MREKSNPEQSRSLPRGLSVAAGLMVFFGAAEIVTGFRHNFFGITTSATDLFTVAAAGIGAGYAAAGVLILTAKRWAAALAIVLLVAVVGGRIGLVAAGLYPMDTFEQVIGIVIGTSLAVFFAIYVAFRFADFTH